MALTSLVSPSEMTLDSIFFLRFLRGPHEYCERRRGAWEDKQRMLSFDHDGNGLRHRQACEEIPGHEYLEVMQSWNEVKKVADEFIHLVIDHDEIYGVDKKKK